MASLDLDAVVTAALTGMDFDAVARQAITEPDLSSLVSEVLHRLDLQPLVTEVVGRLDLDDVVAWALAVLDTTAVADSHAQDRCPGSPDRGLDAEGRPALDRGPVSAHASTVPPERPPVVPPHPGGTWDRKRREWALESGGRAVGRSAPRLTPPRRPFVSAAVSSLHDTGRPVRTTGPTIPDRRAIHRPRRYPNAPGRPGGGLRPERRHAAHPAASPGVGAERLRLWRRNMAGVTLTLVSFYALRLLAPTVGVLLLAVAGAEQGEVPLAVVLAVLGVSMVVSPYWRWRTRSEPVGPQHDAPAADARASEAGP